MSYFSPSIPGILIALASHTVLGLLTLVLVLVTHTPGFLSMKMKKQRKPLMMAHRWLGRLSLLLMLLTIISGFLAAEVL